MKQSAERTLRERIAEPAEAKPIVRRVLNRGKTAGYDNSVAPFQSAI